MAAEGQSDTMASDVEVSVKQRGVIKVLHVRKDCNHWHLFTLDEWLWRPNSGCCISAVVPATWKADHISDGHADFCKRGMQALVHRWQKCIANGDGCTEKQCFIAQNLFYLNCVIVLSLSVVVSMEINRRYYFHSSLCISMVEKSQALSTFVYAPNVIIYQLFTTRILRTKI